MLTRNLGSALRARTYHSQSREIRLRIVTHDLMILMRHWHVRYGAGAGQIPFRHGAES